jgi:hypothetical protein
MARNIEIKARIEGIEALLPKLAALADEGPPCARRCLWRTARSAACVNIARCS